MLCVALSTTVAPAQDSGADATPKPSRGAVPELLLGFEGIAQYPTLDGDPEKPSDVHIGVGPGRSEAGRIVQVTNNGIQLFDKAGETVSGPVTLEEFVGVEPNRCFDPKVLYDQHSRRFFVVMPETRSSRTSRLHVAVSKTSAPQNLTSDWHRVADDAGTTFGRKATWIDYPCPGADRGSLFVTGNMADENKAHHGVKIRVFDKAHLLEGTSKHVDLDVAEASLAQGGTFTVQPAHVFGATPSGNFPLISRCGPDKFRLWELAGAPEAPRVASNAVHSWKGGSQIRDGAPQKGDSGVALSPFSGRVMNALWRDGSLWCVETADVTGDRRTEVVWFRIAVGNELSSGGRVLDSGHLLPEQEEAWTFLPSLGVNDVGDALICYARSSPAGYVEMRVAARAAGDPAGSFRPSGLVRASAGEYDNIDRHNPEKWADYSACVVDPDDGRSFWVAHEFCNVARKSGDDAQWGTFIARIAPVEN